METQKCPMTDNQIVCGIDPKMPPCLPTGQVPESSKSLKKGPSEVGCG